MLKNKKSLICTIVFSIILLFSSFCFAEETNTPVTTNGEENAPVTTSEEGEEIPQQEIYEGDLYLIAPTVTMDKLVSGNVYIMGNDVTITGQVAGNLYIFANKVTFSQAYIQASTYIVANTIDFSAITTDLYVTCSSIHIPANFGAYRDMKIAANTTYLIGAVGRNADIHSDKIAFEQDENKAMIFGNLNYTSKSEVSIPEGSVQGETHFTKMNTTNENMTVWQKVQKYVVLIFSSFATALVVYFLTVFFAKKPLEKTVSLVEKRILPTFGIGLLGLILIPTAAAILFLSLIGIPISLLILAFYLLFLLLGVPIMSVIFTKMGADHFKVEKKFIQILFLFIITVILFAIGCIPYVGAIVKFLLTVLALGVLLIVLFFKNFKTEKEKK